MVKLTDAFFTTLIVKSNLTEPCFTHSWTFTVDAFSSMPLVSLLYFIKLGMIACVHISTALESALTPTARYAASTNPRIETIKDIVLHYLMRRNMGDTGRPGQRWWETEFVILLSFFLWLLFSIRTLYLLWMFPFLFFFFFFLSVNFFFFFFFFWSHRSLLKTKYTFL